MKSDGWPTSRLTSTIGCPIFAAAKIRIVERGERAVAPMLGIRTANPEPSKEVRLIPAGVHAFVVEHLTNLDAATEQLLTSGPEVGDDQVQALRGAGCCPGDVPAEDDRAPRARWRELNHAEVAAVVVVGVEPPPQPRVEL